MVPKFRLPTSVDLNTALKIGASQEFRNADLKHDDLAFLQYTGGTTGISKGAMLTHGNMVANLLQAHYWAANDLIPGKETVITALPLYHIFALTANALFAMKLGAKSVLITNPRDLTAFVKELSKEKFSYLTGINTLFNALLNTPGFDRLDFSHLKVVLGGGMAVQRTVAEQWQQVTDSVLVEAYGLTETSPAVTINPLDIPGYNGSIGLPISSTEISIRDQNGQEVAYGERGELCIRGPQVMAGYWKRPDETAKVIDQDGWLRTGDVATVDAQGFVKLVDRLKDMILVSGFNVYPNEIEGIIAAHPKVLEVGAIGVPNEKSTEAVKVIIVKKEDSLSAEEILKHCHENLTNYKCPKHIEFVDELPKTNVGKILRRELREMYGNLA
jgi:long-chain acyl-CoA synthetase